MLSRTVVSSLCEAAHSESSAHCKSVFSLISMDARPRKRRGEESPDHMYIYEAILNTLNGLP